MADPATPTSPPAWPRIALWGRFDTARFGELLLPRIHELELVRRLPGARVLPWSPMGSDRPIALDGGLTALPLGAWSPGAGARLAATADAVVVAGSDVLSADDEALGEGYGLSAAEARARRLSGFFLDGPPAEVPRALSAVGAPRDFGAADATRLAAGLGSALYLSVRDDVSRRRLEAAGVARDVIVVPDPVALAARVFEPPVLARRLDYLRLMGWYPPDGAPVVVQGGGALAAHAGQLAAALDAAPGARNVPVLLLETEPADGGPFADALGSRVRGAFRLPRSASLVDLLAVFRGARCFIGDSELGHLAAVGFGVPSLFLAAGPLPPALVVLEAAAPPAAPPADARDAVARLLQAPCAEGLPASVAARLETHFDALAAFADAAHLARPGRDGSAPSPREVQLLRTLREVELRLDATRCAWEARSEQVVALRVHLTEQLAALERHLGEDLADREARLAQSRGELDAMRAEFLRVTNLRLFRATAPLRRLYAAVRANLRRSGG